MKRMIPLLMLVVATTLFPPPSWGQIRAITEPPLETQIGWSLLPNGMLVVEYDLDHNGRPDFYAVRVVLCNYFSREDVQQVQNNYPASLVFHVAYEVDSYYYVAAKKPLFYAIDYNEDGLWDLEYKDVMEDGLNGNEKFYDSPSGQYKPDEPDME